VIRTRRWGLVVGGVITVAGCAAFAAGLFNGLDNYTLDLHFRHFSSIEADPRIVLIDINDHALRTVGDWPWPRRRYAQIVGTLNGLGAKAIVMDLVLSEPASPRTEHAGLGPHYDVDTELRELGDRSEDPIIYDDDELRDAMAKSGNVYLAMFFRLSPPDLDPQVVHDRALDLIRGDPDITLTQFDRVVSSVFPSLKDVSAIEALYHQARIAALLEDDFSLGASALARKLGSHEPVDMRTIEQHLPGAKRLVAQRAVRRFLDREPDAGFAAFRAFMLPDVPVDTESSDRNDLIRAYRWEDAFRAVAQSNPPIPPALRGLIPHGYDVTLPVDRFAKAANGVGFVSFEREKDGGVVREIPLVANVDGVMVSQLGLLVAMDVLGIDRASISFDENSLILGTGSDAGHLPLNPDGLTLLNWQVPQPSIRWEDSFTHIPVSRVLEIALNAEAIRDNKRHLGLALAELVELRHVQTPAAYADYVRLVNRRFALREQIMAESSGDARGTFDSELAEVDAIIGRIADDAIVWLRRVHGLWENDKPRNDKERTERNTIEGLYAKLGEGQLAARLERINDNLTARTDALLAELRPQIEDKVCLVGYTASGVADLVTSPVYSSMPGVMAHANIVNMILRNRPACRAPCWANTLLLLLGGVVITVLTCVRGPVLSLSSLFVLVIAALGIGGLTFHTATYHIASLAIATQMCVAWACVTAYRQFTEQRSRRQFQRALAQYTSPAVAARIAERANVADLAPQPARVTCFFSDLYGFTQLSERLGAQRTRFVLNPYLRMMSRVLVEHHAIINKFMGDGIFAFFNAPIWPCDDHSEASCACALASVAALRDLNRQNATLSDGEALIMRIGLSTGEAFVGDYGSDAKLDYTCIGDTVNLGARLEHANKIFGTTVLVDDATRRGTGDRFVFRSLGRVEVPGKTLAVDVHELISVGGRIDAATREYISLFQQAIRHYQSCEWNRCMECLDRCRSVRPDDQAVDRYREAVARYRLAPPPSDWNKAVRIAIES